MGLVNVAPWMVAFCSEHVGNIRVLAWKCTLSYWKRYKKIHMWDKYAEIFYFWYPMGSMYGIFTYIYHKHQPNVGKYCIVHGSYGIGAFYGANSNLLPLSRCVTKRKRNAAVLPVQLSSGLFGREHQAMGGDTRFGCFPLKLVVRVPPKSSIFNMGFPMNQKNPFGGVLYPYFLETQNAQILKNHGDWELVPWDWELVAIESIHKLGGGFEYFVHFTRFLWRNDPIVELICFRLVTTTVTSICWSDVQCFNV